MADVTDKLKDLAQLFREGIITRFSTVGRYRITGEIGPGGSGRSEPRPRALCRYSVGTAQTPSQ